MECEEWRGRDWMREGGEVVNVECRRAEWWWVGWRQISMSGRDKGVDAYLPALPLPHHMHE